MKIIKKTIRPVIDERGNLQYLEQKDIGFQIRRAFWLSSLKKERGSHAHIKTRQFAIILKGSCTMTFDDAKDKKDIALNQSEGVFIEPYHWITLKNFSEDCIILVLASEEYDEKDYIRDYKGFKRRYGK
jgi:mannose-6-phosphate isomerase-like protein (cupin superfamily)